MYKDIFKWVVLIVSQPAKAWEQLKNKEEKKDEFLSRFIYPLIGILTVAAFLGIFVTRKEFDIEIALKASILTLVASFGGFFLSVYILNEIWAGLFKREKDNKLWQRFVGYSSVLMFSLNIVLELIPELFFLPIFSLYTFYIVWEGAPIYMEVEDEDRLKFTVISTSLILITPYAIRFVMALLMPGLHI